MLDRLYSLYVTVISTIKGYGDYFWADVVEKIDEMGEQVLQYQNQCKKLPKALRDWQAYVDCRDTIDNFLEMLPLFQALTHKSMRPRHWTAIMTITGGAGSQGVFPYGCSQQKTRAGTARQYYKTV